MDNEDTRRTRTTLEAAELQLQPNDSFLRALLKLGAALEAMGAAISTENLRGVDAAAGDAFSFLLAAISLFRRLENAEHPDVRRIGTAWYAVRTHHQAVLDVFERAKRCLQSPELHHRIDQRRISLTLALQGLGPRTYPSPI